MRPALVRVMPIIAIWLVAGTLAPVRVAAGPPAAGAGPEETGWLVAVAEKAIAVFQRHISSTDGDRCPMYPSCSSYSRQALRRHGWLRGWIMSCDRLLRCGRDELDVSRNVLIKGRWRCLDPVENNDGRWAP